MIFIDSWVWIEFFSEGEKSKKAEKIIEKLEEKEGVISSTVLMEVKYRIKKTAVKLFSSVQNMLKTYNMEYHLMMNPIYKR